MTTPNDPLFNLQWFLLNTGQAGGTAGMDINVVPVWANYTGAGVRIGVYDDGVEVTHPDLVQRYDATLRPTINGAVHTGLPELAADNHGTSVAGLIVASGNNNLGVVGVAYGARFASLRYLGADGPTANALLDQQTLYDVTNHSWGSTRNYFNDPGGDAALQGAAQNGRGGLGVIMVKAAGNERAAQSSPEEPVGRDANDSSFNTSRFMIVAGSLLNTGFVAAYSSPSAALLVSAPGGGSFTGLDQDITTDRTGAAGYNNGNGTPTGQPDYAAFNGTSAATPVLSGVAALILEANAGLGWRDMQTILAYSARRVGSAVGAAPAGAEADVWQFNGANNWNGGGLHFSNDYGFGLVDALAAVRLAESWRVGVPAAQTSANEQSATATVTRAPSAIPDNNGNIVSYSFTLSGALRIESVQLTLSLNHTAVGDLSIILTSPTGATSDIWRGTNAATAINTSWTFASREFFGELAAGQWTLSVRDQGNLGAGTVGNATLTVYGATATADDSYFYTNEFGAVAGLAARNTLTDTGGTDTLNAAAVTAGLVINLNGGTQSQIAGQTMTIANGTVIENAVGGDGADRLIGNAAANLLVGARGNDTLVGGAGADTLNAGVGDDVADYSGVAGAVVVELWRANATTGILFATDGTGSFDQLIGIDAVIGGLGNDLLSGDSFSNLLEGGVGNDTLNGGFGNDLIDGGANDDYLFGAVGADTIVGGAGNDTVFGGDVGFSNGDGADNISGNAGADFLIGETGNDTLDGGTENDFLVGGYFGTGVSGNDSLLGGDGNDTVLGEDGNDTADGGGDDDFVLGGTGDDQLIGGAGADFLVGDGFAAEAGNDTLSGGLGADTLLGGLGNDNLTGGAGADLFWRRLTANQSSGNMIITDHELGVDRIVLNTGNAAAYSFAILQGLMTQTGAHVTLDFAGLGHAATTIVVQNVTVAQLQATEFIVF